MLFPRTISISPTERKGESKNLDEANAHKEMKQHCPRHCNIPNSRTMGIFSIYYKANAHKEMKQHCPSPCNIPNFRAIGIFSIHLRTDSKTEQVDEACDKNRPFPCNVI